MQSCVWNVKGKAKTEQPTSASSLSDVCECVCTDLHSQKLVLK